MKTLIAFMVVIFVSNAFANCNDANNMSDKTIHSRTNPPEKPKIAKVDNSGQLRNNLDKKKSSSQRP